MGDEPGVEPDAVGGAEPDVLVREAEARRRDGVRARQAREHGHVDEALLQRHQRRQAGHRHAPCAVRQRLQPARHLSRRRSPREEQAPPSSQAMVVTVAGERDGATGGATGREARLPDSWPPGSGLGPVRSQGCEAGWCWWPVGAGQRGPLAIER